LVAFGHAVAATLAHDTLLPAAFVDKLDEDSGASSAYDDSSQIEHSAMRSCLEPLASVAFAAAAAAADAAAAAAVAALVAADVAADVLAAVVVVAVVVAAIAALAVAAAASVSSSVCDWPCSGHQPVVSRTYPE